MRAITQIILLAFLVIMAGCSKDVPGHNGLKPAPQNGDIRFEMGFAPTDAIYQSGVPQTRVTTDALFKSTWEDGDRIGIFAVEHGNPLAASGNYIHNIKLTYSSTGNKWTPAEELWWPAGDTKLDFYAYYPYQDDPALNPAAITFNVKTDQSDTTNAGGTDRLNFNLSDLLTAKADNSGSGYGKKMTVELTFSHVFSVVQVKIPFQGKGFGPGKALEVRLGKVRTKASLNLNGIDPTAPGNEITVPADNNAPEIITMYRVEQPGDTDYLTSYTYRALIPPGQVISADSRLFRYEHEKRQLFESAPLKASLTVAAGRAETFTDSLPTAIHTVQIPSGTFLMGSSDGSNIGDTANTGLDTTAAEPNRYDDEVQHKVTLTRLFYMSRYEVTNAQYAAFLNSEGIGSSGEGTVTYDNNGTEVREIRRFISASSAPYDWGLHWSGSEWVPVSGYEDHPVVYVTWYGAKAYADWVGGSLPTEAQWEYACRGGQTISLPFGLGDGTELYSDMANFNGNYPYSLSDGGTISNYDGLGGHPNTYLGHTSAVGSYPYANGYGLYDMHGNVREWCLDSWDGISGYSSTAAVNPESPNPGSSRVVRGGSWGNNARYCRSAYRINDSPGFAYARVGFRVVFP